MSEQPGSILPDDSVSAVSSTKKKRPGKAQRQANRALAAPSQAAASTASSSMPNQQNFARKMSFAPIPQPGRYPVVFPAGAGEPTRDSFFHYDGGVIAESLKTFNTAYTSSAKFAEFSSDAEYDATAFAKELCVSNVLGICQQTVHAHQNLGLPLGDFSSIATTELYNPSAARAFIRQFGEFPVEMLGTRYLLKSYDHEVTALVRTAKRVKGQDNLSQVRNVLKEHWLPTCRNDPRTAFILASKLVTRLTETGGVSLSINSLSESIFNAPHAGFTAAKQVLPDQERDIYDAFFQPYNSQNEFVTLFTGPVGNARMQMLHLSWTNPVGATLLWNVQPKVAFPELAMPWLAKKPTITRFFSCGTGVAERSETKGTAAQLGAVTVVSGVTVVRNLVAVTAPEFSLLSCFPATGIFEEQTEKRVVLTTSIATSVRAVEFIQRDWL